RAFRLDLCRPSAVRGPVECWALARFAASCFSEIIEVFPVSGVARRRGKSGFGGRGLPDTSSCGLLQGLELAVSKFISSICHRPLAISANGTCSKEGDSTFLDRRPLIRRQRFILWLS